MINNEELEQFLLKDPEIIRAEVKGDGYHYQLMVISDAFTGKRPVARQQWVYGKLKDFITSGQLHALSMKTLTKEEWEKNNG